MEDGNVAATETAGAESAAADCAAAPEAWSATIMAAASAAERIGFMVDPLHA
jgi:hypothetical protein